MLIQDADLEYDPREYMKLLKPILEGKSDVVYGSRFVESEEKRVLFFWHYLGNRFLTDFSNMPTNLNFTDMETCYKVFRREILQEIRIQEDRFGFEPEITAKIAKLRCRVYEVGISYRGRTYAEGKKQTGRTGSAPCAASSSTTFFAEFVLAGISRCSFIGLNRNGESPAHLQNQLGHRDNRMTVGTCGNPIPGAKRQAVKRLDDPDWKDKKSPGKRSGPQTGIRMATAEEKGVRLFSLTP